MKLDEVLKNFVAYITKLWNKITKKKSVKLGVSTTIDPINKPIDPIVEPDDPPMPDRPK